MTLSVSKDGEWHFFFSSLQSIAEQPKSWMISWHLSCWGCNRCACWCINIPGSLVPLSNLSSVRFLKSTKNYTYDKLMRIWFLYFCVWNKTKWQKWSGTISIWDPFCRSLKQLNSSIKILSVAETARPKKIAFKKFHCPLTRKWQNNKNLEQYKANSNADIFIYSVIIPSAYGEPIQPFPMDIIGD